MDVVFIMVLLVPGTIQELFIHLVAHVYCILAYQLVPIVPSSFHATNNASCRELLSQSRISTYIQF